MRKIVFILCFTFLFFGVNYGNATTEKLEDALVYYCDNLATYAYNQALNQGADSDTANHIFLAVYGDCCMSSSNPAGDCSTTVIIG